MSRLCLVFDLDDTLYPERQYALSGFRAAARWAEAELGLAGLDTDMTRLLDEGHLGRLFGMALRARKPDHSPEHLAGLIAAYRDHEPELAVFDDARWALDHFAAVATLGLITDGMQATQSAKVRALGIGPRFREIVYTDALGEGRAFFKPHPRAYELIEASIGNARFVYIGDNPAKDFVAPNALGWTSVMIERPGGIHAGAVAVAGGAPQHVIRSLEELPSAIGL